MQFQLRRLRIWRVDRAPVAGAHRRVAIGVFNGEAPWTGEVWSTDIRFVVGKGLALQRITSDGGEGAGIIKVVSEETFARGLILVRCFRSRCSRHVIVKLVLRLGR